MTVCAVVAIASGAPRPRLRCVRLRVCATSSKLTLAFRRCAPGHALAHNCMASAFDEARKAALQAKHAASKALGLGVNLPRAPKRHQRPSAAASTAAKRAALALPTRRSTRRAALNATAAMVRPAGAASWWGSKGTAGLASTQAVPLPARVRAAGRNGRPSSA